MEAYQLRLGQLYNLKVGDISYLVTYLGEVGGWLTFRAVEGKYQEWQFTPETLEGVTLAANTVELSPKEQPDLQLLPFTPEVLANPVADVINKPIIKKETK